MGKIIAPISKLPMYSGTGYSNYNYSILKDFSICGGWVVSDSQLQILNINGNYPLKVVSNAWFRPVNSPWGFAAEYMNIDLGNGIVTATGSPSTQSFTYLARVNCLIQPGDPGVLARSSSSDTVIGSGNSLIPLWRNVGQFDMRVGNVNYNAAGTWTLGQWYDIEIVGTSTYCNLYVDGQLVINGVAATLGAIEPFLVLGDVPGGELSSGGARVLYSIFSDRALSTQERLSIRENPWQLFQSNSNYTPLTKLPKRNI